MVKMMIWCYLCSFTKSYKAHTRQGAQCQLASTYQLDSTLAHIFLATMPKRLCSIGVAVRLPREPMKILEKLDDSPSGSFK